MNLTLGQKQAIQALVEAGAEVATVAYNPTTVFKRDGAGAEVTGTPEADAVAAGWVQYIREATATWVEVIYTR